jgi:hypothetical protein
VSNRSRRPTSGPVLPHLPRSPPRLPLCLPTQNVGFQAFSEIRRACKYRILVSWEKPIRHPTLVLWVYGRLNVVT